MTPSARAQRPSKVLVVGGAGYVGTVLVSRLLDAGYEIRVLDSLIWGNGDALRSAADHPGFEFHLGDMRHRKTVDAALEGVDSVVLLAGLVGDPITKKYPRQSADINLGGVQTVISATLENKMSRLVFASTCSNYGLHDDADFADETSPLSPLSLYAEQKVATEEILLHESERVSTAITILRFATAFGISSRMRVDLTISHFAKDAVNDGAIEIYDADTWRPYCHVADLSEAVRIVLGSERSLVAGEVFNVGSTGQNFTKRMIGELIIGARPNVKLIFGEGGGDARNYRVSFERIEKILGFQSQFFVEDHLPRLLSAMEQGIIPLDAATLSQMGNYELPERADFVIERS